MSFGQAVAEFGAHFWPVLLLALPRLLAAWCIAFVVLVYSFNYVKHHIRPQVLRLDERLRTFVQRWRYGVAGDRSTERTALTWFFRFWTNFSSSPALTLWSCLVPVAAYKLRLVPFTPLAMNWQPPADYLLFYVPGWSFGGAMLFSFVSKRIFKRVRPPRPEGSFGHKMKDGSFPSGHSLTSLAFWVMLTVALHWFGVAPVWVLLCGVLAVLVPLLTGLSRIYLGVHHPSDVLGGYFIALVWSVVCYFTLRGVL